MYSGVEGTSLEVQWVRLHAPIAEGMGLNPGWRTRSCMPHGERQRERERKEERKREGGGREEG